MAGKGKEKVTEKVTKGTEKVNKRSATWQEITKDRASNLLTKEGAQVEITGLEQLKEYFNTRFYKEGTTMAAFLPYRLLGYHMDMEGTLLKEKDSNFSRVTGEKWKGFKARNNGENGEIFTVSSGSYGNHWIFILPNKEITAINHGTGKQEKLSPKNWNYLIPTNHGRAYRISQFLSYQFNLKYMEQGRNKQGYNTSNTNNLNFYKNGNNWRLHLTKIGNYREFSEGFHPMDILPIIREYGSQFTMELTSNQDTSKYFQK